MGKQQTALGLIITELEAQYKQSNTHTIRIASAWAAELIKSYLPYERAQIQDAYDTGINNLADDFDGEEYFNNRFKK